MVKAACDALCFVVLDAPITNSVPPSILLAILNDIVLDTAVNLSKQLLQLVSLLSVRAKHVTAVGLTPASKTLLPAAVAAAAESNNLKSVQDCAEVAGAVMSALVRAFVQNLAAFISLPAFSLEIFWRSQLKLICFYLDTQSPFGKVFETYSDSVFQPELSKIRELADKNLRHLLNGVEFSRHLVRGGSMWNIMREEVSGLSRCPDILAEILEFC